MDVIERWKNFTTIRKLKISEKSRSPEKNRDEYLNCDLKYGLSEKPAPKNQKQLRNNLHNHMVMLQGNQVRVRRYFKHKDIRYAPAGASL